MNIPPSDLFATLAHDTHPRCLMLLMSHDKLGIRELTHAIGVNNK